MEKWLANHYFRLLSIDRVANWFFNARNETVEKNLRSIRRHPTDFVSGLDAHTLYDIGERDCRPQPCRAPIWQGNPYHLLIEAIIGRDTEGFDQRL